MLRQHMTDTQIAPPQEYSATTWQGWLDPRLALRRAFGINRPLTLLGLMMLLCLGAALIGLALDPRVITGAPAWLKPFKFAISISVYSFTLLWMLSFVQGRPRLVSVVSNVTLIAFMVEMVIVITQVLRGTTSHFNIGTAFDSLLFSLMGLFVIAIWAMNLLAAVLLLIQRLPDPALAWAIRFGLLLALTGAATGFLMTQPTPTQQAALAADQRIPAAGAHSVGVTDGGPGLPIVGWSTTGGDLRVGHFVGLHALQVLPLVGWLLTRRRARKLGDRWRVALVWIAGLTYGGLITLLTWQALRGQPLLAPDATTLMMLGGLVGAAALATIGTLARARRQVAYSSGQKD